MKKGHKLRNMYLKDREFTKQPHSKVFLEFILTQPV